MSVLLISKTLSSDQEEAVRDGKPQRRSLSLNRQKKTILKNNDFYLFSLKSWWNLSKFILKTCFGWYAPTIIKSENK